MDLKALAASDRHDIERFFTSKAKIESIETHTSAMANLTKELTVSDSLIISLI